VEEWLLKEQRDDEWVCSGAWRKLGPRWELAATGHLTFQNRIYAPAATRQELLERFHNAPTAGHGGSRKFEKRVSRRYFWNSLRNDVETHTKKCTICARTKARTHRPYASSHRSQSLVSLGRIFHLILSLAFQIPSTP
jgi:hypothetical protein